MGVQSDLGVQGNSGCAKCFGGAQNALGCAQCLRVRSVPVRAWCIFACSQLWAGLCTLLGMGRLRCQPRT